MKDFLLPEKWAVKIGNKEDGLIVARWAKLSWYEEMPYGVNYIYSDKTWSPNIKDGWTLIDIKQFKQYVLGMKEEQKEIVGWKLKDEYVQYKDAAACVGNYNPIYDVQSEYIKDSDKNFDGKSIIPKLKQAGVLDLWFTPVFANKTPQIVVNGYKAEFSQKYVRFGYAEISSQIFVDLHDKCHVGDDVLGLIGGNKQIESVTIGKGTFTKEQIKQIATYYTK